MADDTAARVKKVVAKQLGVEESALADEARFVQDLGADSMKSIELIAAFEEEFDLDMDMDEAGKVQTIGGAVEFIAAELEK
jgi:acyl carrier protein